MNRQDHEVRIKDKALMVKNGLTPTELLNNSGLGLLMIDRNYNLLAYNLKAEKLMSFISPEELEVGESMIHYLPEHEILRFIRQSKSILQKEFSLAEWQIHLPEVEDRKFRISLFPLEKKESGKGGLTLSLTEVPLDRKAPSSSKQVLPASWSESDVYLNIREDHERIDDANYLRLLKSVIVNANDAVVITEAEPLEKPGPSIVYVNQAFCENTGYSREEVIGRSPRFLQGPATDRKSLDLLKKALRNWESCEVELINYRKDGTPFWVHFTVYPVCNEEGWYTHWVSIQRNISDRKKTEELIAKSEANLTALINNTKDLILSVDLEGRLLTVNHAYLNLLNERYGLQAKIGDRILEYLPRERAKYWKKRFDVAFQGKSHSEVRQDDFREEKRYFSISVNPIWQHEKILGCTVFARDITRQQKDKEALHRSNQLLESIMNNAPFAMYAKDRKTNFTAVNPGMERILGKREKDILGRKITDLMPPKLAKVFRRREVLVFEE